MAQYSIGSTMMKPPNDEEILHQEKQYLLSTLVSYVLTSAGLLPSTVMQVYLKSIMGNFLLGKLV